MPSVTELQSFEELSSLRHTWRSLWEQTPDASFFRSWEWLRGYWRNFAGGQQLRTLVVTDKARPIGIVPFVVRPVSTKLGNASILTYPSGARGPAFGPVGPQPEIVLCEAFKHVSQSRGFTAVEFPLVEQSESESRLTVQSLQSAGMAIRQKPAGPSPAVNLASSWDCYMDERSLDCRERFLASERHLSRFGPLSFYRWRPRGLRTGDTARRWDLYSIFDQLTVDGDDLICPSIAELSFIRELHPAAVDAGAIDLGVLSIAGRAIACSYGYQRDGLIDVLFIAAARESGEDALNVLLGQLIRDSFLRRDRRLAFRPEHAPIAAAWQNESIQSVALGHYPWHSPQAQLLKRGRQQG